MRPVSIWRTRRAFSAPPIWEEVRKMLPEKKDQEELG